jgi:hypothetical protein
MAHDNTEMLEHPILISKKYSNPHLITFNKTFLRTCPLMCSSTPGLVLRVWTSAPTCYVPSTPQADFYCNKQYPRLSRLCSPTP